LIIRAKAGDPRAFDALVRAHASFAHNVALRTLGDAREAEDVTQEAFVRAWRALPRFREDGRFSTWLYRIVVNLCYDRVPRLRRQLTAMPVDAAALLPDRRPTPESAVAQRELRRGVSRAMDRLPDPYRMLLLLRHQQQLSYAEIAEIAGMPLGTVKTGIHRGRKRLRVLLAEDGIAREGLQSEAALSSSAVQEASA
jgi:RNA polymerase sigma-70 factor (ECF subfamily)